MRGTHLACEDTVSGLMLGSSLCRSVSRVYRNLRIVMRKRNVKSGCTSQSEVRKGQGKYSRCPCPCPCPCRVHYPRGRKRRRHHHGVLRHACRLEVVVIHPRDTRGPQHRGLLKESVVARFGFLAVMFRQRSPCITASRISYRCRAVLLRRQRGRRHYQHGWC